MKPTCGSAEYLAKAYSPPQVDRIWLWIDYNRIPTYSIFYLLTGHYNQGEWYRVRIPSTPLYTSPPSFSMSRNHLSTNKANQGELRENMRGGLHTNTKDPHCINHSPEETVYIGGHMKKFGVEGCLIVSGKKKENMVVSQNKGPQYRPQNTIVLIKIGTPKMVPLILGNPYISFDRSDFERRCRSLACYTTR